VKINEKTLLLIRKEILKRKVAACGGIDKLEPHKTTMFDLVYLNTSEPDKV
jgi:hypothetical protein